MVDRISVWKMMQLGLFTLQIFTCLSIVCLCLADFMCGMLSRMGGLIKGLNQSAVGLSALATALGMDRSWAEK